MALVDSITQQLQKENTENSDLQQKKIYPIFYSILKNRLWRCWQIRNNNLDAVGPEKPALMAHET